MLLISKQFNSNFEAALLQSASAKKFIYLCFLSCSDIPVFSLAFFFFWISCCFFWFLARAKSLWLPPKKGTLNKLKFLNKIAKLNKRIKCLCIVFKSLVVSKLFKDRNICYARVDQATMSRLKYPERSTFQTM